MDTIHNQEIANFLDYTFSPFLQHNISNKNELLKYIEIVSNIQVSEFVDYIMQNYKRQPIYASDVFQFSKLEDAMIRVCLCVKKANNPGMKFKKIGELLLDDGEQRSDIAFCKYGENHIKTAELLGLAFKNESLYYLSVFGLIIDELPNSLRKKLLTRLILRNKLISQLIISSKNSTIDLEAFLYDLSQTTYLRRRTNIKQIIEYLCDTDEYDFSHLIKNIKY